jgi:hypothetical protein
MVLINNTNIKTQKDQKKNKKYQKSKMFIKWYYNIKPDRAERLR